MVAFALTSCGPVINDDLADSIYIWYGGTVLAGEEIQRGLDIDPANKSIRALRNKFPDHAEFEIELAKQPDLVTFRERTLLLNLHLRHAKSVNDYIKIVMKKAGD